MATSIRSTIAHSWAKAAPNAQIRGAVVHTWASVRPAFTFNKRTKELLVDLVVKKMYQPATQTQIHIVEVVPNTDVNRRQNTRTRIQWYDTQEYIGHYDLYYDRIPITEGFPLAYEDTQTVTLAGETSTWQLISKLNALYGIYLEQADIVDEAISVGQTSVIIKAAPTSYVFSPDSQYALLTKTNVNSLVDQKVLSGFKSLDNPTGLAISLSLSGLDNLYTLITTSNSRFAPTSQQLVLNEIGAQLGTRNTYVIFDLVSSAPWSAAVRFEYDRLPLDGTVRPFVWDITLQSGNTANDAKIKLAQLNQLIADELMLEGTFPAQGVQGWMTLKPKQNSYLYFDAGQDIRINWA